MATQVDQALSSLKKGEDYIQAGLVALPEYASELADVDADGNPLIIDEYRALMKRYVTMDNEYKAYITSVNDIKCLVGNGELSPEEVANKLDEVYENHRLSQPAFNTHEAYREFEGNLSSKGAESQDQEIGDDEDFVVQEETQNFKCPYTGKEMVDPVKNNTCGHSYEKEGIMIYIKQRGKRAKCPVPGCTNQGFITHRCLVPDKKLKKEIEKKNKQAKK